MTHSIIVIGKTGQLARALAQRADKFNVTVEAFGRDACDLSAPKAVIQAFTQNLPRCDGVILAAAYTAVDAAEDDTQTALQVNGLAPEVLAKECVARNIPFVHISTDYVFPGGGNEPLRPEMLTAPINMYGQTKRVGEKAVLESGARAAILRTSWVFDGTGKNFLTTMLRLGQSRDKLSVVADQIGRPTYAGHLADACFTALIALINDPKRSGGLYHVSGTGAEISWADFAKAIFSKTSDNRAHKVSVNPIPSSDYPTPAKRPYYSVLDVQAFETDFGAILPDWDAGLDAAIIEWKRSLV